MQNTRPDEIAATLNMLAEDEVAGRPTKEALEHIEDLFSRRGRPGIEMASRALRTAMPADRVEALCIGYAMALRR